MSVPIKPAVSLTVSAPSFWHCGRTTASTMQTILIGLAPAAILAVLNWGGEAIRVMALSIAACVFFEAAGQKLMHRRIEIDNCSAVVEGLLLAFLLPAAAPWWLVIIGAAITMLIAKAAFGGLGATPLCAPLVGWAALTISWPVYADANAMQLATAYVDPLVRLKYFGAADVANTSPLCLLLGAQIGGLGASQAGAVLLGGLFILARKVVRLEIPIAFLCGVIITSGVFYMMDSSSYASPLFHLLTGSTLLGAFFMAGFPGCSPKRPTAMIVYGLVGGALVVLIRIFGIYTDGVPFAILLSNLLTPQLETFQPKPFGVR